MARHVFSVFSTFSPFSARFLHPSPSSPILPNPSPSFSLFFPFPAHLADGPTPCVLPQRSQREPRHVATPSPPSDCPRTARVSDARHGAVFRGQFYVTLPRTPVRERVEHVGNARPLRILLRSILRTLLRTLTKNQPTTYQSTNLSPTHLPTPPYQPTHLSTNQQPTYQPTNPPTNPPTHQPTHQPTYQPTNQLTN